MFSHSSYLMILNTGSKHRFYYWRLLTASSGVVHFESRTITFQQFRHSETQVSKGQSYTKIWVWNFRKSCKIVTGADSTLFRQCNYWPFSSSAGKLFLQLVSPCVSHSIAILLWLVVEKIIFFLFQLSTYVCSVTAVHLKRQLTCTDNGHASKSLVRNHKGNQFSHSNLKITAINSCIRLLFQMKQLM